MTAARGGWVKPKPEGKGWPPPIKSDPWHIVEITEGRRTWWEVRTWFFSSFGPESGRVRHGSLRRARRDRDERNQRYWDMHNRTERIVE